MKEFNGYNFDDKEIQGRMKYLVITKGDLDINNAYGFETKEDLIAYLKEDYSYKAVLAIIKIDKFLQFNREVVEKVSVNLEEQGAFE
jgi:hypothetical protein